MAPKKPSQRRTAPAAPSPPPGPDWSRPLARPVQRHGITLAILADVLQLYESQEGHRQRSPTWQGIRRTIEAAAAGADIEAATDAIEGYLRIDPGLRIAEEELHDVCLPLGRGGKRIFTVDVGPDAHAASLRRPASA